MRSNLLEQEYNTQRGPGGWGGVFYPIWGGFLSNTVSRRITCYYDSITNVLHVPVYVIRVSYDIMIVLWSHQETRCLIRRINTYYVCIISVLYTTFRRPRDPT